MWLYFFFLLSMKILTSARESMTSGSTVALTASTCKVSADECECRFFKIKADQEGGLYLFLPVFFLFILRIAATFLCFLLQVFIIQRKNFQILKKNCNFASEFYSGLHMTRIATRLWRLWYRLCPVPSRYTRPEALEIARRYHLEYEVIKAMDHGCTPDEALQEWDIFPREGM